MVAAKKPTTGMITRRAHAPSVIANMRPNQTMKPTTTLWYNLSVFATTPCRGLSISR